MKVLRCHVLFMMTLMMKFLCIFGTIVSYRNMTAPSGFNYQSVQVFPTHIADLIEKRGSRSSLNFYQKPSSLKLSDPVWDNANQSARIRSSQFWTNLSSPFLYFSKTLVQLSQNYTQNMTKIYQAPDSNTIIKGACFGDSVNQIFIFALFLNEPQCVNCKDKKCYGIIFYNKTAFINKRFFMNVVIRDNDFDLFLYKNRRLVMMYQSALQLYPVLTYDIGNISLRVNYNKAPLAQIDAKLTNQMLFFTVGIKLTVYEIFTKKSFQYNFTEKIHSISVLTSYVFARSSNKIYQYDYQISQAIHQFPFKLTNQYEMGSLNYSNQTYIASFIDSPQSSKNIYYIFNVTIDYAKCLACTCNLTYQINPNTNNCQKNYSITPPFTDIPMTFEPEVPVIANISVPLPPSNNYTKVIDQVMPNSTAQTVGTVMIAITMRIAPKFLMIFTLFLNDLWFYKFHRKFDPEYPLSTKVFMQKIDVMKQFQLNPSIITDQIPFMTENQLCSQNNQILYERLNFSGRDPQQVYFLYSTQQFYKNNILITLFYFVLFKIIHLPLFLLRKTCGCVKTVYEYVRDKTKWWTILISLVESNGVMLSFYGAIQLLNVGSCYILDKVNIVTTFLSLFLIIFYSYAFYKLVQHSSGKKSCQILLVYTKITESSTLMQPLLILARSLVKSFFHGFFITNYSYQIISLTIVDLIFLLMCLKMMNKFKNKFVYLFLCCYLFVFFVFDCFFTVQYFNGVTLNDEDREMYGFMICCLLLFLSTFMSLSLIFQFVKESYKDIKKFCNGDNTASKNKVNLTEQQQIKNRLQNTKKNDKHCTVLTNFNENQNPSFLRPNSIMQQPSKSKLEEGIGFNFTSNDKKIHKAVMKVHKKKGQKMQTKLENKSRRKQKDPILQVKQNKEKKGKQKSIKVRSAFDGQFEIDQQ